MAGITAHGCRLVRRTALAAVVWFGSTSAGWAQSTAAATAAAPASGDVAMDEHQVAEPGQPANEYPSLHISGFGDVDYSGENRSAGPRGFSLGQVVLHLASGLSPHVNVFSELSFTARPDAGSGSPAVTGFNAEVERLIIRFDQSDYLKVSFGRYHTPINWWNTEFHHGLWLQTTIARPEMVMFGGKFIPVHFVGALVEGSLPANGWHVNYQAGVGNGRGNVISRAGDAGDNNDRPAWLVNVFSKPDRVFGLQVGGSVYEDRISVLGKPEFNEQILAGHAVWRHEDPEVIAEIAQVRHTQVGDAPSTSNLAYYIQGAYRFHGIARLWKPYYRFEHVKIDPADTVFTDADVMNLDGSTIGVRYDIATFAAIKTEARTRTRAANSPRVNGWFLQFAFTF